MTVVVWTNESTAMFLNSQPIPDDLILDPKLVRSEPPSILCKSAGPDMSETRIHTARSTHLYQSPVPAKNTSLTRFSPSSVAGRRSWSWVLGIQWVHGPGVVRLLYMLSDSEPGKEPLVAALTIKGAISSRGTERAYSKAAIVTASEHRSMEATWEEIVTFRNRLKFGEVESECFLFWLFCFVFFNQSCLTSTGAYVTLVSAYTDPDWWYHTQIMFSGSAPFNQKHFTLHVSLNSNIHLISFHLDTNHE